MSDAEVRFHVVDGEHRWTDGHESVSSGREQAFSFACPLHRRRCGDFIIVGRTLFRHDPSRRNGGIPQWEWDGNRKAPTFEPSIDCKGCWHGFIRDGRCVDAHDGDELRV